MEATAAPDTCFTVPLAVVAPTTGVVTGTGSSAVIACCAATEAQPQTTPLARRGMSTALEVRTERICLLDDTVKHTNRWERRAAGTCSRVRAFPARDEALADPDRADLRAVRDDCGPSKALMGASLSLCVAACARVGEAARRRIRAADLLKLARVVGIGGDILLRRIKNWSAEPPTQP